MTWYALIDHLCSIDKRRIRRVDGQLSSSELAGIDQGLELFLVLASHQSERWWTASRPDAGRRARGRRDPHRRHRTPAGRLQPRHRDDAARRTAIRRPPPAPPPSLFALRRRRCASTSNASIPRCGSSSASGSIRSPIAGFICSWNGRGSETLRLVRATATCLQARNRRSGRSRKTIGFLPISW